MLSTVTLAAEQKMTPCTSNEVRQGDKVTSGVRPSYHDRGTLGSDVMPTTEPFIVISPQPRCQGYRLNHSALVISSQPQCPWSAQGAFNNLGQMRYYICIALKQISGHHQVSGHQQVSNLTGGRCEGREPLSDTARST